MALAANADWSTKARPHAVEAVPRPIQTSARPFLLPLLLALAFGAVARDPTLLCGLVHVLSSHFPVLAIFSHISGWPNPHSSPLGQHPLYHCWQIVLSFSPLGAVYLIALNSEPLVGRLPRLPLSGLFLRGGVFFRAGEGDRFWPLW